MKAMLVAAMLVLGGPALADGMPAPEGPHLAMINGSIVQIVPGPHGQVTITYVQPRPGLVGVASGSVLLQGQWQDGHLAATVYGTNIPCRTQVPYPVSGSVNGDGVPTLVGQAPLIDNATCAVIG